MPKTITSPVKKWPGTVVLQDPILFPAYIAWKQAVDAAAALEPEGESLTIVGASATAEMAQAILPGICAVVQEWKLEGLPASMVPESFPATPRKASVLLLAWLISEITSLVVGEEEIPNA
jgi:hypothetical protein